MGNNRFMVVSEEKDIIAMNPSYTEENARIAFAEIKSAYESGKIDVYI